MSSMLESANMMIEKVARSLQLSETQITELTTANEVHSFEITVSGYTHKAYRVQHSNKRGPYKGGIRFHGDIDENEVRALALLMSIKTAAVGIPMGGGKGGVAINNAEHDATHLESVSRQYASHLRDHLGPYKDVPGPDVGTNAQVLDWMADEFEKITGDTTKAAFTGKSIPKGGSEGREAATGRGGMIVLKEYLQSIGRDPKTVSVAVQGVGNVGFWFAKLAEKQLGVRVVAVSDSRRTLAVKDFEDNERALSFEAYKEHNKGLIEDLDSAHTEFLARDAILSLPVDILVLAALGDVVTAENTAVVQAPIILELANGPVSEEAHDELVQQGATIIPDVVANAGGVIVSYLEWQQNLEKVQWSEALVNKKLDKIISQAAKNMLKIAKRERCSLKEAAFMMAIEELLKE